MTLKLICLWIFSQNADISDYINLEQVPHLRHITTNNPNLQVQSKPTLLVDLTSYIKGNIQRILFVGRGSPRNLECNLVYALPKRAYWNAIWNPVFNILQATRKLLTARNKIWLG